MTKFEGPMPGLRDSTVSDTIEHPCTDKVSSDDQNRPHHVVKTDCYTLTQVTAILPAES